MSKLLDYNGFRTMATWLASTIKAMWEKEQGNFAKGTAFVWVGTTANMSAVNAELSAANKEGREPISITLPDLVDGEQVSLVPSSKITYMYS